MLLGFGGGCYHLVNMNGPVSEICLKAATPRQLHQLRWGSANWGSATIDLHITLAHKLSFESRDEHGRGASQAGAKSCPLFAV